MVLHGAAFLRHKLSAFTFYMAICHTLAINYVRRLSIVCFYGPVLNWKHMASLCDQWATFGLCTKNLNCLKKYEFMHILVSLLLRPLMSLRKEIESRILCIFSHLKFFKVITKTRFLSQTDAFSTGKVVDPSLSCELSLKYCDRIRSTGLT